MLLTIRARLLPDPAQASALLTTMERFAEACAAVGAAAFEKQVVSRVLLQRMAYRDIRQRFAMPSQMAVRAISKAADAFRMNRTRAPRFPPHGPVPYDRRVMSFKGPDRVSLLTLDGRVIVPWLADGYQEALRLYPRGQGELVRRPGGFFLLVNVDVGDASDALVRRLVKAGED